MNLKIKAVILWISIAMSLVFVYEAVQTFLNFSITGMLIGSLTFFIINSWYNNQKKGEIKK